GRAIDTGKGEQGLDLGGECPADGAAREVEGLLTHPVAGERQRPVRTVPDGEREHALEPPERPGAALLPGAQNHLGVAVGREAGAGLLELLSYRAVVVNLAVEHQRQASALAEHRLVPVGHVDDGETANPERNVPGDVKAALVRTPVDERG